MSNSKIKKEKRLEESDVVKRLYSEGPIGVVPPNEEKSSNPKPKRKPYDLSKRTSKQPSPVKLEIPINCDHCTEVYYDNIKFALHSIKHNKDGKYSCHICGIYTNNKKYNIEMHVRTHEGSTKYKCEVCKKAFASNTYAIEHKYFHSGEKPFQCEICGKNYMFSRQLYSHRRTSHYKVLTGNRLDKYDCDVCKKHYESAFGLKRHKMTIHDNVDFSVICEVCGKKISSKEKLKFHIRTHTGEKPYPCSICGKRFSKKQQMVEHTRVHTGEKPYVCPHCGKRFSQRTPLVLHIRIHTGEKPKKCLYCGEGFISKSALDSHMKKCLSLRLVF